jgi:hypothetical protein
MRSVREEHDRGSRCSRAVGETGLEGGGKTVLVGRIANDPQRKIDQCGLDLPGAVARDDDHRVEGGPERSLGHVPHQGLAAQQGQELRFGTEPRPPPGGQNDGGDAGHPSWRPGAPARG